MIRQRYSLFLLLQAFVIIAVTMIFKSITDRQIAATVAGTLFIIIPVGLMFWEFKANKFNNKIWFAGALQFLILFALPIMGLRLLNWNVPFEYLSFLGIKGPALHEWSSRSYLVWMIITFITSFKANQALKKKQKDLNI